MENYHKAASFLQDEEAKCQLTILQDMLESPQLLLTVWGHFSAGKSELINSLLGSSVLPSKTSASTAVITYIRYGEKPTATAHMSDGSDCELEIGAVKSIFEDSQNAALKPSEIDYMDVYYPCQMLRSGLVLVDTPGINSCEQRHLDLAGAAIENSGRILYVLGAPLTAVDVPHIQKIHDAGIYMDVIRTKCDCFSSQEEDANVSLERDRRELEQLMGSDFRFIAVSNRIESPWYVQIDTLRRHLERIAENIKKENESAVQGRLAILRNRLLQKLNLHCEELELAAKQDSAELQKCIRECEERIAALQASADAGEKQLADSVKAARKKAEKTLSSTVNGFVQEFEQQLSRISEPELIPAVYQQSMERSVRKIIHTLNSELDLTLSAADQQLWGSTDSTPVPSYQEIRTDNENTLQVLRTRIHMEKETLERLKETDAELEKQLEKSTLTLEEYKSQINQIDAELASIPNSPVMRISTRQPVQPSQVLKRVGDLVDLALLLLPVGSGTKAAAEGTKAVIKGAKTVTEGAEIIKVAETAAEGAKKASSLLRNVDKVRDTVYVLNTLKKSVSDGTPVVPFDDNNPNPNDPTEKTEKTGKMKKLTDALDMLSVSYWTELLGKQFDHPPVMEIDPERDKIRLQTREHLTARRKAAVQENLKKLEQVGLIRSEQEKQRREELEHEKMIQEIEKELYASEQEINRKAQTAALKSYARKYLSFFDLNLTRAADVISQNAFSAAVEEITTYETKKLLRVKNELASQISRLTALRDQPDPLNTTARLNNCRELITALSE